MLRNQSGNVFFAIFGAVALVGVLTAGVATFVKGPLATSVKITRQNTAENQMSIAGQVAVMAAANTASSGDCDADGFVEPIEWREDLTKPFPVGGGLIPSSIGISKKDPWGTEYGYCVWDHGPAHNGAGSCGGATQKRLEGTDARTYSSVALVSAGPDKTFTTTCRTFDDADVNNDGDLETAGVDLPLVGKANPEDDDIIFTYTYEEATGASGGLWSLKSGDPGTAVINKKLETQGSASFAGGVLLPDSSLITCDPTTAGVMALNASGDGINICDGAGHWDSISGGGGATSAFDPNATCTGPADAGKVRFNTTSGQPEFCNGTQWLPFTINIPGVNLVISPNQQNAMNVDGGNNLDTSFCTVASGMYCGAGVTFTVTNQGTLTSSTVSVRVVQVISGTTYTVTAGTLASPTNASNFILTSNTCTTTLAPNATCNFTLKPKANGNVTYTADVRIIANNNPIAIVQGAATNFGCLPGRMGPGGYYAACGLSSLAGTYNLVLTPGNCADTISNPSCPGTGYDTVARIWGDRPTDTSGRRLIPYSDSNGAQATADLVQYAQLTGTTFPAAQWCYDLTFGGYNDWYLPAYYEFQNYIFPQKAVLTGFYTFDPGAQNDYWTSTYIADNAGYLDYIYYGDSVNGMTYNSRWITNRVRCARRDGLTFPAATVDTDPDNVSLTPAAVFTSSGVGRSNTVTISGIMQTVSASIAGGTGMNIIKNGGSIGATSVSGLKPGDTLAFEMNGPAVMGTKNTGTITIGSDVYSWWVGYADSTKEAKVFLTSPYYNTGNFGGLAGMDAICNTLAGASTYGLSGMWKAMASDSTMNMMDRIPWNWGVLKTVTGTVVANGYSDMLDGSLQSPMNITEKGVADSTYGVATGSNAYGQKQGTTAAEFNNDWTYNGCTSGIDGVYGNSASAGQWAYLGKYNGSCGTVRLYCIENVDDTSDVTPSNLVIPYVVQAALSSRQSSSTVVINGMSNGATATMSVTATGGNPKFTINGGAEVSSGTVRNGDAIVFLMDAPATSSTFNRMTVKVAGVTTIGNWRVWSGWDGIGTGIKRVFITSTDPNGAAFGGVTGGDTVCQSRASAASLGGTWKAIMSGISETEWAVNRVGYNWNELRLVDGTTTVAYAPNLWTTLLNPVIKTEFGSTRASTRVLSGTASNGQSYSSVPDLSNMYSWTGAACSATYYQGNSSALSVAITQGYWLCQSDGALFCIEQ